VANRPERAVRGTWLSVVPWWPQEKYFDRENKGLRDWPLLCAQGGLSGRTRLPTPADENRVCRGPQFAAALSSPVGPLKKIVIVKAKDLAEDDRANKGLSEVDREDK
jgi:hypothetical protein